MPPAKKLPAARTRWTSAPARHEPSLRAEANRILRREKGRETRWRGNKKRAAPGAAQIQGIARPAGYASEARRGANRNVPPRNRRSAAILNLCIWDDRAARIWSRRTLQSGAANFSAA